MHRARPDVTAIAHAHTVYGRAWSATGRLLEPISQDACAFYEDHAVFDDYTGVVYDPEEGSVLARALGSRKALLLEHHGLLTVGETVDEAAFWLHLLERCCQAQLLMATLRPGPTAGRPTGPSTTRSPSAPGSRSASTTTDGWGSSPSTRRSSPPSPSSSTDLTRLPTRLSTRVSYQALASLAYAGEPGPTGVDR